MLTALEITLLLLAASIVAVLLLRAVGMPALVAYLLVGVVLGPYAGNLAANTDAVHTLAELGVVFLMFTLGLEFNLSKLGAMRRFVLGLGSAQVVTTIGVAMLAAALLPAAWIAVAMPGGLDWRGALALGGAVAMSSTALVSKLLAERHALETDHGRRVFAVLLFQDLALIPLLIVIPALGGGRDDWLLPVGWALAKAAVLLVVLLRFGPPLMQGWFLRVARQRSHELFTLNILLAALLFAWLTKQAGLSMELGAFVAGMLISETEYRYQVEEDIKPFRDILLGLFFITIGMKLDLGVVLGSWPLVALYLTLPILLKFAIVVAVARAMGDSAPVAIRTGVWLAQAGEFAFVLLALAADSALLAPATLQPMLAAMLLSMLASPWLIGRADWLALRVSNQEWLQRSLDLQKIAARSLSRDRHVVICGYGRSGQSLAHVLEAEKVPFVALDLDPDRVREAASAGESVVYGDATRRETLLAAGVHRASVLVVTYDDTPTAIRLLHQVRALAPQLPVVVRTATDADLERLREAGATEVVPEVVEGSLMLASHALALTGAPLARVLRRIRAIREDRYSLLRGWFHGADDREAETIEIDHQRLHAVTLLAGSAAVGRPLSSLTLDGCEVSALVRGGRRQREWPEELRLQPGDTLVLAGTVEQVHAAEARLLRP
ncbi:MAG: cation:proton antiporter [Burkholderiaceae bacterium]|jgi:CPA2 family monovalent cation:H+ antiporter-2|nr:cation:proton antiporter [Burkholderiales bacterium]MCZ8101182.1 cation:proton antiporter [Burkholderiales bacterium]MCZ8341208.1 cation:proton antiporter [Burkholderiaceae bacterium]